VRLCLLMRHGRLLSSLTAATAAALLALTVFTAPAWSEDFVLVRNAKNRIDSLTRTEVRELAMGRKKAWPHGPVAVMVLTREGTPELAWFASAMTGLTESSLLARIREQVFKGEMRKPITAASEQDILAAVASDTGAIGIVRAEVARKLPPTVAPLSLR
jgi:hypothetical protein